ncbi:MAG TPA: hypothetical protein PLL09_01310 [Flavobacterium sp.]|uniref:hypothetical protein n=1 Tax=unclassified Flavobacterium TaxID=196869 RepID=UPI000E8F1C8E|nr:MULTISPECIES: hypothetical protein [unclassified Flavobacterium]HBI02360.1 hypothetical protein [Flavobacterium sp.]HRE76439.1 hypothetical protein [Flavobacterium sp.]
MKQLTKIGLITLIFMFSCSSDDDTPNGLPSDEDYVLGGTGPAGGIIFYLDAEGHGYEMAETIGTAKWQDITNLGQATNIPNLGTIIGTGEANTETIVTTLGNGNYAAKLCADFEQNEYDDWFLPSKDELIAMYNFFDTCGCVSMNPINNYWSSSQGSNAGMAWNTDFMVNVHTTQLNNWTFQIQKDQELFVKPIRKF